MTQSAKRRSQWVAALLAACGFLVFGVGTATAESAPTVQDEIAASLTSQGFWDESSVLDTDAMGDVVAEFGDRFAFAFTDRSFSVQQDPDRSAAALLALSALDDLQESNGPRTLLFVTQDDATGASNEFPFANIVDALNDFDRDDPEASFAGAAAGIAAFGSEINPELTAQLAQTGDSGLFSSNGLLLILVVLAAVLGALAIRSAQKKKARKVYTTPARDNTALEIQQMSDLILKLDPQVTISNDKRLQTRFVDASDTYREVLEEFQSATTGHELADLRIDISKARWKLDVIDAEIEGKEPPSEPFTRDNSGSAWNSTRGDGAD